MSMFKIATTALFLFAFAVSFAAFGAGKEPARASENSSWLPEPAHGLVAGGRETAEAKPLVDSAPPPSRHTMMAAAKQSSTRDKESEGGTGRVWRSEDLSLLGIGLGVGDVDGDGNNEIVVLAPSTVYLYRVTAGGLNLVTEYSAGTLELKSVDVASLRKQGPPRIYVSAQNRGAVSSFVLEYRNGALVPVIREVPYFLRVIIYPTHGPILLGQKKGSTRMYEGPIMRLTDKGDALQTTGRFGVPLKIPIFGFAIGDLAGNRKPLIAVYDRSDHLRVYQPDGKRLYVSKDYYGSSDVILRWSGMENQPTGRGVVEDRDTIFYRPRIMSLDLQGNGKYEVLAITHSSKTLRLLSRTRMLEEGRVVGLTWNGDALEDQWSSPKIEGVLTDFTVDSLPGMAGLRLITLERKRTDWLSFLRSKSQIRAYDIRAVMGEQTGGK